MTRGIRLVRIGVRTVVVAAALAVLPASADAREVFNERQDVTGSAHNPCSGEDVEFVEGQMHTVIATGADQGGGVHYNDHVNFAGVRGVGLTSGDEYVVPYSTSFSLQTTNGATTNTAVQTFQIIRTGSEDDYLLQVRYHLTVKPDGEVAVEHIGLEMSCKG
jgi:hypothetical protein